MAQYKLEFQKLFDEIAAQLPEQPQKNEVRLALNRALRRINSIMTPEEKIITITGSEGGTTIGDMTTVTIGNLTDATIGAYTRFGTDFSYDSTDYSLKLDDSITRVAKVFLDDEEWENWPYEVVKNTSNSDQHIYHFNGRNIYFPKDIGESSEVIKLIVEMYFPEITEDMVLVPLTYQNILIDGAMYYLMRIPKYRDETKYSTYFNEVKKSFFDQIEELEQKNFELAPKQYVPKKFFYKQFND